MCQVEKEHLVSCQISYFPIDSRNYLEEVDRVLEVIKESKLDYQVGDLASVVKGQADKVFKLLAAIDQEMSKNYYHYTMSILLSNICGCELA